VLQKKDCECRRCKESQAVFFAFQELGFMKATFYRSSTPERGSELGASASVDPRVTALLFVFLLAASFYGEALRWQDGQATASHSVVQPASATAASAAKTVASHKQSPAIITGC
jgi:hypothetical protein